jgi:hypothetical protein
MSKTLLGGKENGRHQKVEIIRTTEGDLGTTVSSRARIMDLDTNPNPGKEVIERVTMKEAIRYALTIVALESAIDHFLHTTTFISLLTAELQQWMITITTTKGGR